MTFAAAAMFGGVKDVGQWLVTPAGLHPALRVARQQPSSAALALGADGTRWHEVDADAPRRHATAQRLLIEGARGNAVRNPRGVGAVPGILGSGGAAPSRWAFGGVGGIPLELVETGQDPATGIDYVRFRLEGTSATRSAMRHTLEIRGAGLPVAPGETAVHAHFIRTVDGAQGGLAYQAELREYNGTAPSGGLSGTPVSAGPAWQRVSHVRTMTDAAVTNVLPTIRMALAEGRAIAWIFDIGWPQLERGGFASAPILPSVGSLVAGERGSDLVTAPLPALDIWSSGECTILWAGCLAQAGLPDAEQVLLQIDDGSDDNRVALRSPAGGAGLVATRTSGGGSLDTAIAGDGVAGESFCCGISVDGAGRIAACLNGGAVAVLAGGPLHGMTTLRIGSNAQGAAMFGAVRKLRVLPFGVADGRLMALSGIFGA